MFDCKNCDRLQAIIDRQQTTIEVQTRLIAEMRIPGVNAGVAPDEPVTQEEAEPRVQDDEGYWER